jgi:hypothetical protein
MYDRLLNNRIAQLTGVGASTDTGRSVLLNAEEELKPEPGLVTTLLELMVVHIVLGNILKLRLVMLSRPTNLSLQTVSQVSLDNIVSVTMGK